MTARHDGNDKMRRRDHRILNTIHDEERRINALYGGYNSAALFREQLADVRTVDDDSTTARIAATGK